MTGKFIKVRCQDCNNEQLLFDRAKTQVHCAVCGTVLAVPKGGKAEIKARIVEI